MSEELDAVEDRLLRAAARGFELESSVEIDDAARIDRLARQFERRGRRPAAPSHARSAALGFAAALLLVGTLVGAIQLSARSSEPRAAEAPAPAAPVEVSSAPVIVPRVAAAAPPPSAVPPPSPSESAGAPIPALPRADTTNVKPLLSSSEVSVETAPVESPPAPPPSANELFSAGNKARSRGDTTGALALYERLQSEYPAAPESLAARISIGMLELQRGRASAALSQFRAYRRANARSLRAEASWGEAEALRALGRSAEERAALETLLLEHPSSAYAPAARKRLGRD